VNAPMKAAIVTGALPGIGRAVALRLASNTAKAVHSAGVMKMLPLSTSNNQGFDATFATNVRETFNVLKQAARRVSDGSRIVTLSTSVIALSLPGYGPPTPGTDRSLHTPATAGTSRDARGHRECGVVPRRSGRWLGQSTGAARQWRVRLNERMQ